GRMSAPAVDPGARHDGDVGLGLRFVVQRDGSLRAHEPARTERRTQRVLDQTDGRVVRLALRLADDQLAAQQLDRLARLEHADLDQPIVLGARPAAPAYALAHGPTLAW